MSNRIRSLLFILASIAIYRKNFLLFFKTYLASPKNRSTIDLKLKETLVKQLAWTLSNVEYYRNYEVDKESINVNSVLDILSKLPILKKKDIIMRRSLFISDTSSRKNLIERSTGGSTGETLRFFVSPEDAVMSTALLYRGWKKGGYRIGDKVAIIAGGSLVSKNSDFKVRIIDYLMGFRRFSSYGVDEQLLFKYCSQLNSFKPKFIRGYASSIYMLAKYIRDNSIKVDFDLKAIFTTSEMLEDKHRRFIQEVFTTKVYDGYGLDDGGLTAFECRCQSGFHIDHDRSYLEVVDDYGNPILNMVGRIVSTNLTERGMPFLRYETGDLGIKTCDLCECGEQTYILSKLIGRTTDTLNFGGKLIGGPVLTVLMGKTAALQYQFVQTSDLSLQINIVAEDDFSKDEQFIRNSLKSHLEDIDVTFIYVDQIKPDKDNKHKFIIKHQ